MKSLQRIGWLALGVVLAGCGDSTGSSNDPTVNALLAPSTVAAGGDVTITITTEHFTLELPSGQPNAKGHGHYNVYLDNATGGNYLIVDAGGSTQVTIPLATIAGLHTLKVQLYNNDSSPLAPAAFSVANLTVQ